MLIFIKKVGTMIFPTILFFFKIYAENTSWPFGSIHCFGDSHCPHFFTKHATWHEFLSQEFEPGLRCVESSIYHFGNEIDVPFIVHYMGPRTMHRVGIDSEMLPHDIEKYNNDIFVFVFGEIDVRAHIARQIYQKGRDCSEVIQTLVANYVKMVSELPNCKSIISAVSPPGGIEFMLDEDTKKDPGVPVASLEDRISFTRELNERLAATCKKCNILFFDPFESFSNPDGSLNDRFSSDNCHIMAEFNYIIKRKLISFILDQSGFFQNDNLK